MAASQNNPLGVYIHWPFCASKCPYCDFNSHVRDGVDQGRWRTALLSELNYFALETNSRTVDSVFFGGGTPSLMAPETTAALIEAVRNRWQTTDDLEITLEANPSTAETGRFEAFRAAGVNRLSIGVQSLRDQNLSFLGRGHSVSEAKQALDLAAQHFPRFSFDLMYGLPRQTAGEWAEELDEALEMAENLGCSHMSLYQLTVEPGTDFHRDAIACPEEDISVELYEITQERLCDAGLPAYEISNHAKPGAECRHNLGVWRGGEYLGIGPGAHGRIRGRARTEASYRMAAPERWLKEVEDKGHGTAKRQALPRRVRAEEILMTGLRLMEGVDRQRFHDLTGRDLEDVIDGEGLARLAKAEFVEIDDTALRATSMGQLCLNEVLRHLLAV
ncbi:MAG: coproporphyrinogen III oxidase [Rhodospirillales bacterium]|nr:coproporphyrinogen III oxidase [Rhodospirillales bacterium]